MSLSSNGDFNPTDDDLLFSRSIPAALDTTSALPLLNSLTHLTYLTSTSPRIREILTLDGGLERLLHILRQSAIPRPPSPPPDLYGLSISPSIPASTGLLSPDRAIAYRFSLAFQCVSNVGVRGSEQIRTRVVQAGVLDVVAQVLEVWLRSRGLSTEAGPLGNPSSRAGLQAASASRRRERPGINAAIQPASTTVSRQQARIDPPILNPPPAPPPSIITEARPADARLHVNGVPSIPIASSPAPVAISSAVSTSAGTASSSGAISPVDYISAPGSVPTSGDEDVVGHGSGTVRRRSTPLSQQQPPQDGEPTDGMMMEVDAGLIIASDEETARLAQEASVALQNMAGRAMFATPGPGAIPIEDPTPRGGPSHLPISNPSSSRHRPPPARIPSTSRTNSLDNQEPSSAVASSATSTAPIPARPRPSLLPMDSGMASDASSPGVSNTSTPMGTPTGTGGRERSGTLIARPAPVPARRRRRERQNTGSDSGTTGGEGEDYAMDGDGDDVEEGATGAARAAGGGAGPASVEVGIVQGDETANEVEADLAGMMGGNVDLQMGAPPGAPGAVTPRTGTDATPRQAFLDLTNTPGAHNPTAAPVSPTHLPEQPNATTPNNPRPTGLTAPAPPGAPGFPAQTTTVALATAQATQRTLRDLSLEGNVMTPSETTYRDDDILLSLQLLAYLSKYPHVRQAFHKPREPFHPDLDLKQYQNPADPPFPMRRHFSRTPNIFSLVERFTFRPSPTDPTVPQLPEEIVYWAGVIMRNACRKDESRGGIRQCANMSCGKWESSPRQFAKCRRCRKAKYCSKDCQSKAWSEGHRFWCS
jgi:hypothetical protein